MEDLTGRKFNSALLNKYNNENDHMSPHADDEKELGDQPYIISITLGWCEYNSGDVVLQINFSSLTAVEILMLFQRRRGRRNTTLNWILAL
jgi:hypothetical protein